MMNGKENQDQIVRAYNAGRRVGFGISALVLSIVAYLSMLGFEKAILAIVLGALALKGTENKTIAKRLGIISICLGILFVITAIVILIIFRDKVAEFITLLKQIS